ncbi:hypothetical protein [Microbacterium sp. MYb62]|uniref:hypothetical protein n=1 Tax=Microbacterium sp. MYb62 TaxID=1848690 RepID=UPI000CFB1599|nr:hypothetical protein [Microbacterium sp. MYb62]PRB12899.1 hypothetical protein CQ042_14495 [Microbacterium sp. MYb62]
MTYLRAGHAARRPRRRAAWAYSLAGFAFAIAAVLCVTVAVGMSTPSASAEQDLKGNSVVLDPDATVTPELSEAMDAEADIGERLVIGSRGLDVPLGQVNEVDGVLTPPGFSSAYLVRNLGVPPDRADEGTTYVVMHSLAGEGIAPGDFVTDVANGRASIAAGEEIDVAGVVYAVSTSSVVSKTDLPTRTDVWAPTPDRLVIITCLQLPSGTPSTQNLIIEATRVVDGGTASG